MEIRPLIHRNWFTLVVRLLGILFVGLGITKLISSWFLIYLIQKVNGPSLNSGDIIRWTLALIGATAQVGFGVYLLFGGERLINWCLRSAERMPSSAVCIHCGYDLSMSKGKQCPECGSSEQPSSEVSESAAATDDGESS